MQLFIRQKQENKPKNLEFVCHSLIFLTEKRKKCITSEFGEETFFVCGQPS